MKNVLLFSILFCAIALPALGELTEADLNEIRLIVNDAEKRIKIDIKADIAATEKQMKEYINTKNESIEKRLSLVTTLLVTLTAVIGVPLVVLTIMIGWRSVKDNPQQKEIETLRQEIETLKQQRIVNP